MSYKLIVEQEAELHLDAHIKAGNKILLRKIYKLFEELQEHPETGTGKPEKLRYKKMEIWSRRIDNKHRMEYIINNDKVKALNMAISEFKKHTNKFECLIHHSDRGVQYCSYSYVNQLKKNNIYISMTQSGDPLENATAERVNGIVKDEYLLNYQCNNIDEARVYLSMAVWLYNNERPHSSIGNLTPEYVHNYYNEIPKEKIKRLWKNYYMN